MAQLRGLQADIWKLEQSLLAGRAGDSDNQSLLAFAGKLRMGADQAAGSIQAAFDNDINDSASSPPEQEQCTGSCKSLDGVSVSFQELKLYPNDLRIMV